MTKLMEFEAEKERIDMDNFLKKNVYCEFEFNVEKLEQGLVERYHLSPDAAERLVGKMYGYMLDEIEEAITSQLLDKLTDFVLSNKPETRTDE